MIRISKNKIRATGSDANSLFIAMTPTKKLIEWQQEKFGGEEFQRMVNEAIKAREDAETDATKSAKA